MHMCGCGMLYDMLLVSMATHVSGEGHSLAGLGDSSPPADTGGGGGGGGGGEGRGGEGRGGEGRKGRGRYTCGLNYM